MPLRNLFLQQSDDALDVINFTSSKSNIFDNNFDANIDMEQWQDWMKWDGSAVEIAAPILNQREGATSSVSSIDLWSTDIESAGNGITSAEFFNGNEFPFEDAPFETEETLQSCHGLPLENENALFATTTRSPLEVQRPSRGYPSLTEAEVQSLQDIAMPYRLLAEVKISEPTSPAASLSSASPSPSPEPEIRTRKNKKRKSIIDGDLPAALCQSRKRGHNAIEKRYRTNLNEKINCLREGVPALTQTLSSESRSGGEGDESDGDGDEKSGQQKYGKAAILTRALEYIKHLEGTTQRLGGEVDCLKTRVGAFEKLAMSGSIMLSGNGAVVPSGTALVKSETLESIQANFQQIKPIRKSSISVPTTRKRATKLARKL